MKPRPVRLFVEGGRSMVAVPLARDGKNEAIISHDDYSNLISLGVYPNWQLRGGSVASRCLDGPVLVARVLLGIGEGERVRYLDGDRLNLRRENLKVVQGWSVNNDLRMFVNDSQRTHASGLNASEDEGSPI